jgi:AraC-like DNA-binding protein
MERSEGAGDAYRERPTEVRRVVLWQREVQPGGGRALILPDGCLDLIWDGQRLFVAGPDSRARWHEDRPEATYTGLRFAGGSGPAFVGLPAHELLDAAPEVDVLWSRARAEELADRMAEDPAATLESWLLDRHRSCPSDPLGVHVLAMAEGGIGAAAMADRVGLSPRQLHRRCLALFGYGPRRLVRVVRMGRALEAARRGAALVDVAARCGYADQAHLSREIRDLTDLTPGGLLRHLGLR